jgi:2,3-bisphosphoglycerate-dependent phosphoglycerate mutase
MYTPSTPRSSYVALIRHGDYHHRADTPGAFQPYPLNSDGRRQSLQCVPLLTAFSVRHQCPLASEIHCSSLLRAWQTAEMIAHGLGEANTTEAVDSTSPALIETPLLGERCVGSLANLTVEEIEQVVRDDPRYANLPSGWKSNSHFCLPYPGAESLMQAGERVAHYMVQVMQAGQQRYPDGFVQLFVAHGAAFRHAAYHLGVLSLERVGQLSMHYARPVFLRFDGDQSWHHHSGDWKVRPKNPGYTD